MKLNPYQKIIKNGHLIQEGDMNTPLKFSQLTEGVDLKDKNVLDIGCNLGMMCNLAKESGANVRGMDINNEYIKQAKDLFPNIPFQCCSAEDIAGDYDIIIASAIIHYLRDLDSVLKLFAQCSNMVLCDVWLNDNEKCVFTLSHRGMYIPSESAFRQIAHKYFNTIKKKGQAISPDPSRRYVFHLSDPIRVTPQAVIIYGDGNTGKTTTAHAYIPYGYIYLGVDHIARTWNYEHREHLQSVGWFANAVRGKYQQEYVDYFLTWFANWLLSVKNRDIVMEGYDLMFEDVRDELKVYLENNGWEVTEIYKTEGFG
jgi:2-polyprenyl-3-methyl-5-hydroxy-6-metoxy-1,4-benzoquinol methylase